MCYRLPDCSLWLLCEHIWDSLLWPWSVPRPWEHQSISSSRKDYWIGMLAPLIRVICKFKHQIMNLFTSICKMSKTAHFNRREKISLRIAILKTPFCPTSTCPLPLLLKFWSLLQPFWGSAFQVYTKYRRSALPDFLWSSSVIESSTSKETSQSTIGWKQLFLAIL